jgi:hypothetical protein
MLDEERKQLELGAREARSLQFVWARKCVDRLPTVV